MAIPMGYDNNNLCNCWCCQHRRNLHDGQDFNSYQQQINPLPDLVQSHQVNLNLQRRPLCQDSTSSSETSLVEFPGNIYYQLVLHLTNKLRITICNWIRSTCKCILEYYFQRNFVSRGLPMVNYLRKSFPEDLGQLQDVFEKRNSKYESSCTGNSDFKEVGAELRLVANSFQSSYGKKSKMRSLTLTTKFSLKIGLALVISYGICRSL